METTRFNATHDELTVRLARNTTVRHFYNVGSVFAVMGTLASLVLVTSSIVDSITAIWPTQPPTLLKRELSPIIPGITVPFADVPLILLALFLSQAFHELGHAIAAAVDDIPLNSVGVSLLLSAFVSLPAAAVAALPPISRLRIAAAGAHHNLVAYAFLAFFAASPLPLWFRNIAFTDVSHLGRLVVRVHSDSPLYSYLPPTSLITAIDDVPATRWSEYLTTLDPGHDLGWCVPSTLFDGAPRSCCPSSTSLLTCFLAADIGSACLDPIPILTARNTARCTITRACAPLHTCVTPHPSTRLTRLTVLPPGQSELEILLWSGPRLEIFDQVLVTNLAARSILLPIQLWDTFGAFFWYVSSAALSLFFFNLLPIPPLDGAQVLAAALCAVDDAHLLFRPHAWLRSIRSLPRRFVRSFGLTSRVMRHTGGMDMYALLESNRTPLRVSPEYHPITPRRRAANSHLRLRTAVHAAALMLVICAILVGAVRVMV